LPHHPGLSALRRDRLSGLPSLPREVAVRPTAGPVQNPARPERARGLATCARFHTARSHTPGRPPLPPSPVPPPPPLPPPRPLPVHPALLPRRAPRRLSFLPLYAHASACARGRCGADPGARPRRRRRRADPGDRERRGQEDLAGRHPLAVTGRPRPVDARHL